jgi:hypothetical protein
VKLFRGVEPRLFDVLAESLFRDRLRRTHAEDDGFLLSSVRRVDPKTTIEAIPAFKNGAVLS